MTHYELLKMAESALRMCVEHGVTVKDVEMIHVYEDYDRMEREGHKKTFIVAYLSEQYGVPVATIYRLAKRMRKTFHI